MINLWEDMETGSNASDEIYAVVERLRGEHNKYGYDKDILGVVFDRALHSNIHCPSDYDFVPQAYCDDEDPFDVLVLVEDQTFPGCVTKARPVTLMEMDDDDEQDDRVVAIPVEDPRYDHIEDLNDVPQQTLDETDEFFATHENLEVGKEVETLDREDKQAVKDTIEHAMDLYEENFA